MKSLQSSKDKHPALQNYKYLLIYFGESFLATWIRIQPTKTLALYLGYYWSPTRAKENPTGVQDQYGKIWFNIGSIFNSQSG
jgi:hypothetical protein